MGACERPLEHRLDVRLADDVADDAAELAAQEAQLPMMAFELLGVGIAPRQHGGAL